jgi:hypothetical protein
MEVPGLVGTYVEKDEAFEALHTEARSLLRLYEQFWSNPAAAESLDLRGRDRIDAARMEDLRRLAQSDSSLKELCATISAHRRKLLDDIAFCARKSDPAEFLRWLGAEMPAVVEAGLAIPRVEEILRTLGPCALEDNEEVEDEREITISRG